MKIFFLVLIVFGFSLFQGCSLVYIPSAPVVFNHEEEGDFSVDIRQGILSTNLQGGYAISDNFNVGASASALYNGDVQVVSTTFEGMQALDLNLVGGYYTAISDNKLFEMNMGLGNIFINNDAFKNYSKLYLQPSIGFQSKTKNATLNLGLRAVGTSINYVDMQSDTLYYNGFIEPFLSLSAGNIVHFLMQTGLSVPLLRSQLGEASPFIVNFGVGYSFSQRSKDTSPHH